MPSSAPLLHLPDFGKKFEVKYDARKVEIEAFSMQDRKHIETLV